MTKFDVVKLVARRGDFDIRTAESAVKIIFDLIDWALKHTEREKVGGFKS